MLFYPIFSSVLCICIVCLDASCGVWACVGSSSVKGVPWESRQERSTTENVRKAVWFGCQEAWVAGAGIPQSQSWN